ncbi:sugar ABC transporter permease [Eisenbergiella massiliensis]|uniref:Sugar ABC transporter permease n=2 Tax=Lachnospiraceae TaxID=186803 RepID=A0A3E3IYC8_9FIRM|nr:sugar ABC transporter permease [Clostridium sp.]RGE72023.1 sugar ABC transporter permease [Eisenbergiella massiliensis]
MFLPMLILFLIFSTYPVIEGVFFSFTDWDGLNSKFNFIGLQNYKTFFHDFVVLKPLYNTFIYAFWVTIIQNICALALALALNQKFKTKNLLRTFIFVPVVLSSLIVGYIWSYLFTEPIAMLGDMLGIEVMKYNLLGNKATSLAAGIFVSVWKGVGYTMVIYLAGLQNIDKEVKEAALVDGAKGFQHFRYVTFPLIAPSFTINIVLVMEGAFKQFDLIFALTGGGPGNSSELLSLTIYRESFEFYRAGYGTTMGVILALIIIVLSLFELVVLRKRENNIG